MPSKQVLVMKKFPKDRNMRTGKYCAQASHAAVGAIFSIGSTVGDNFVIPLSDPFVKEWVVGNFKKVTVYVDTDPELIEIYKAAHKAGLPCSLIRDAGLTEFNGVPTLTAVGIGPGNEVEIDKITGHLKLF
jgi:PTH2 family peptidyl-tRNA hydrolase